MAIRQPRPDTGRSKWDGVAMSLEQYLALPEEKPYLEYFEGRVVQKAVPRRKHAILQGLLVEALRRYARGTGGAAGTEVHVWFGFRPTPGYRIPDVAYWAPAKPQGNDDRSLPPTLAIEIRSPDEPLASQRAKCRMMRAHGVDVAWLIDPEARIAEVYEGERDGANIPSDGVLESPLLPGLRIELAAAWAEIEA
jgi:Uma2 family endonuclease